MSGFLRIGRCTASLSALALAACATEPADTTADTQTATTQADTTTADTTGTTGAAATGSTTVASPTTGSVTAADSTTAGACGAGGIDDCCCFDVSDDPDHPTLGVVCMANNSPCEAPQARCPAAQTACDVADLEVTSAEGLECILDALAGGEPAVVTWGVAASDGISGSSHTLFVQADGTAFASSYTYNDVSYTYGAVERRALQPASFFSGCVALPDTERFDCLERATLGAATETCVDGFMGVIGR
jgi:hypothetical protein